MIYIAQSIRLSFRLVTASVIFGSGVLLLGTQSAYAQNSETKPAPNGPETSQPEQSDPDSNDNQVPTIERLDELLPFDPDMTDTNIAEGPLPDQIDPDTLDDGLKELLQNLPASEPEIGPEASGEKEGSSADTQENESDATAFPSFDRPLSSEEDTDSETDSAKKDKRPDYSKLSKKAERAARLDVLFSRLGTEEDESIANLIAEEIWAVWLSSGSASVDFLVRRGTAAHKHNDLALSRRMYDYVTQIMPDYAEGWSRSARLSIEEEDLNRALVETTETLIREPRHFYALWTMGNILERLGRLEAALAAYEEANRLYPALKTVKDRADHIRGSVEGDVL